MHCTIMSLAMSKFFALVSLLYICTVSATPLAASEVRATGIEVWRGNMSYPCTADCPPGVEWLAHNVAINITVDTETHAATIAWVWTVLPTPSIAYCVPKVEHGLRVSVAKGSQWFARGTGSDAAFYSLEATLSSTSPDTLANGIVYFSPGGQWPGTAAGTFTAMRDAHPSAQECVPPPPAPTPPPTPTLWPLPANISSGNTTATLAPEFTFHCVQCAAGSVLDVAFARYDAIVFAERPRSANAGSNMHAQQKHSTTASSSSLSPSSSPLSSSSSLLTMLNVTVGDLDERFTLQLGMNEAYLLNIPLSGVATLTAPTVWGALRGLETFAQLVRYDWDGHQHVVAGVPHIIDDSPRFPHRAFMIDTARHWQPLPVFTRLLDGMAACKLNTLHWHISDLQSSPFESVRFPKIWESRWSDTERYGTTLPLKFYPT
jgi:hypothetical protein